MITPTDCVKDRLAAYYYCNDPQSLEQALVMAQAQEIDLGEIRRWSKKEGRADKYADFLNRLKNKK